jgi:hypothetical protein
MSDFLGHLAARSGWAEAGRLETLKPRLPSRFEPAGTGAAPGLADIAVGADASEGAGRWVSPLVQGGGTPIDANLTFEKGGRGSLGALASRRPDSAEPQEPARTPALPGRNLAGKLAPMEGTPRPDLSAAKVAPRPLAGEPAAATMLPEESPPTEEPAPRRRRAARPAATDSEEAPESAADRPVSLPVANRLAPPAVPLLVANRLAPPAAVPVLPSPPPEPAANRLAPRSAIREGSPAAVRLVPKVTLASPAPAAAPLRIPPEPRSSAAPPEPTIQVTIGRLEVRATPAPAAAAASNRKGAAPPALALEEYLNRRSRRGER